MSLNTLFCFCLVIWFFNHISVPLWRCCGSALLLSPHSYCGVPLRIRADSPPQNREARITVREALKGEPHKGLANARGIQEQIRSFANFRIFFWKEIKIRSCPNVWDGAPHPPLKKWECNPLAASHSYWSSALESAFNSAGCQQLWQLGRALASTLSLCREAVVGNDKISLNSYVEDLFKGVLDQSSLSGSKLPWPSENSHILKGVGVICNVEGRLTFCQEDSSQRRQIKAERSFYFFSSDVPLTQC